MNPQQQSLELGLEELPETEPKLFEVYVHLRLEGLGAREAARDAGYAHGVPSSRARKIYEAARKVKGNSEAERWVTKRLEQLEGELAELRALKAAIDVINHIDYRESA